jgi:hypothetical protein
VECVAEEILPNNTFVSGHLLGTYSSLMPYYSFYININIYLY